jgi:hypothetical protein
MSKKARPEKLETKERGEDVPALDPDVLVSLTAPRRVRGGLGVDTFWSGGLFRGQ